MSDYNLGTAHGKIRVDYEDKGFKEADKDMSALEAKAKQLAAASNALRKRWQGDMAQMASDTVRWSRGIGVATGGLAFMLSGLVRLRGGFNGVGAGMHLMSSLGLAMGMVPKGAEGFPRVVLNIIRIGAAIALFKGSMGILANLATRFTLLRGLAGPLSALGGVVGRLGAPFTAVSGAALTLAASIAEFRFAKSLIKPVLMLNGAMAGLGFGIQVIAGLIQALRELSGIALLLPGILLSAGLAAGVLKIGLTGVKDALKSGDIKGLAKEAGQFVTAVRGLDKEWKSLTKSVQGAMFKDLGAQVKSLAAVYLPFLKKGFTDIGGSLNFAAKQVTSFMQQARTQKDVQVAMGLTSVIIKQLALAIRPLLQAFMDVAIVGIGVMSDLTQGAGGAAQGFAAMVRQARESGKLAELMRGGVTALKELWTIAKNVGSTLSTIFKGLGGGESKDFLATLVAGSQAMRDFFESAKGQAILSTLAGMLQHAMDNAALLGQVFVDHVLPAFNAFLPVIQTVSDAVMGGFTTAIMVLSPLFVALGNAISFISPVLYPIIFGMVKTATVIMGLGLAIMIVVKVFYILHAGLSSLKFAFSIAAFAARLFTGNLRGGEAAALRFVGVLIKNMAIALFNWVKGLVLMAAQNVMWVASTIWAAITSAAQWIWAKTVIIAQWIAMRVAAAANAIWTGMVWVAQTIASTVATVAAWVAARAQLVALWIMIKVQAAASAIAAGAVWVAQAIASAAGTVAAWVAAKATLIAGWIAMAASSAASAIASAATWVATHIATAAQVVAAWVAARVSLVAAWLAMAVSSAASAIASAATWVATTIATTAQIVGAWLLAKVQLVAGWIAMAASAVANAALMAGAWLLANGPGMLAAVAAAVVAFGSMIAGWVSAAAAAVVNAVIIAAQWFIALGPVGWVIGIIVALVAVFVAFWPQITAAFQVGVAWLQGVWTTITGYFDQAMAAIQAALGPFAGIIDVFLAPLRIAVEVIKTIIAVIVAIFSGNFDQIGQILTSAGQKILSIIGSAMSGLGSAVMAGVRAVVNFFSQLPGQIVSALGKLGGMLVSVGKAAIDGLLNGLRAAGGAIKDFLLGLIGNAVDAVKSFLGIASPSKLAHWLGEMFGDGWTNGVDAKKKQAVKSVISIAQAMKEAAEKNRIQVGLTTALAAKGYGKTAGTGDKKVTTAQAVAQATPVVTWDPYARATGGDGSYAPTQTIESVTIDAKSVAELNSIVDFFDKVQQKARAGKAD